MLITSTVEICIQQLGRVEEIVFTARRSYASAVFGVVILSVCPSVRPSVRLSDACFVTNPKNLPPKIFNTVVQQLTRFQLTASLGPSAIAELLICYYFEFSLSWKVAARGLSRDP